MVNKLTTSHAAVRADGARDLRAVVPGPKRARPLAHGRVAVAAKLADQRPLQEQLGEHARSVCKYNERRERKRLEGVRGAVADRGEGGAGIDEAKSAHASAGNRLLPGELATFRSDAWQSVRQRRRHAAKGRRSSRGVGAPARTLASVTADVNMLKALDALRRALDKTGAPWM